MPLPPLNFDEFIHVLYKIGQILHDPSTIFEDVIEPEALELYPAQDDQGMVTIDTTDPVQVVEFVNRFIQGHPVTEDMVREVLDKTISDANNKAKFYAAAVAQSRISQVTRLLRKVDVLEEQLFSEDRIRRASTHDLVKMNQELRHTVDQALDFIKSAGRQLDQFGGKNEVLQLFEKMVQIEESNQTLAPHGRERLRQIMDGIRRMAEDGDSEALDQLTKELSEV